MTSDSYFLSRENPVANVDQRDLEAKALRMLELPALQKARVIAAMLWREVLEHPVRDQATGFDGMVAEYVFNFALRAANSDACYPKVLRIMSPPAHWFGRDVPGSRWGGDNADLSYRIIPIAYGARYEIRSRPVCSVPPIISYSLMGNNTASPVNISLLDGRDLPIDDHGESVVTVDATPADGRPNHIQTKPGSDHLMIRDEFADWLTQAPHALRVRRLDPPERAALSDDELAQHAAKCLLDGLYFTYYTMRTGSLRPPNEVNPPRSSGAFGGMATQWGSKFRLCLEEDEAVIVTATAAGASFHNASVFDLFFKTTNYWSRSSTLSMTQMAADEDGRFTYVVAHQDPGVHNWLDPCGLRRTILGHRWQSFPRSGATETPTLTGRLVKFKDLDATLPPGVRRIDAARRREQLAQREAGFKRRFIAECATAIGSPWEGSGRR